MKNNATSNKWFALTIVLTAPLLYVIDIFIINMAIPGIQQGVHATNGEMQLVIAGYLLGSASLLIIGGRAGDYLGKKKVFLWGMMLFTLSSCCCGLSQTAMQLNIMRFFQGVSSALMVPQSIAYIQVLFTDPKERAKAIGWYGATLSIAAIIGQRYGILVEICRVDEQGKLARHLGGVGGVLRCGRRRGDGDLVGAGGGDQQQQRGSEATHDGIPV